MLKKFAFVAAVSLVTVSAQASTDRHLKESVELEDGSIVHIFKDGKMGMENRHGRAVLMPEGHAMQVTDGRTITMKGNEVARVTRLQETYHAP